MNDFEIPVNKTPVVLLHAFPLSSEMWRLTADSLSNVLNLIMPDLAGLGKAPGIAALSITKMAEEVHAFLEKKQIKEPVFLTGLSMGGYVAFEFYKKYPGRVKGLGLFSTRAEADTPEISEKRLAGIEKIKKEGLPPFLEGTLPKLLGATTLKNQPQVLETIKKIAGQNTAEGVTDALSAIAQRHDSKELLKKITCPVLILAGREDTVIPVSAAETMAAQIPHSVLHIFEKAGHLLNLEAPAEFESILHKFITVHFLNTDES